MNNLRKLAYTCLLIAERHPDAMIERNDVGNIVFSVSGELLGYVDVLAGEAGYFDEDDEPWR